MPLNSICTFVFYRTNIIHMTTSMSRIIGVLRMGFKVGALCSLWRSFSSCLAQIGVLQESKRSCICVYNLALFYFQLSFGTILFFIFRFIISLRRCRFSIISQMSTEFYIIECSCIQITCYTIKHSSVENNST